jgi:hypothetical protein
MKEKRREQKRREEKRREEKRREGKGRERKGRERKGKRREDNLMAPSQVSIRISTGERKQSGLSWSGNNIVP